MEMRSLSIKERKEKTSSFLTRSKKYTMIEEFKDKLRGLKNVLNEIKKTGTIEKTRKK